MLDAWNASAPFMPPVRGQFLFGMVVTDWITRKYNDVVDVLVASVEKDISNQINSSAALDLDLFGHGGHSYF